MDLLCRDIHFMIDEYLDQRARYSLRSVTKLLNIMPYWRFSYRHVWHQWHNRIISLLRFIISQPLIEIELDLFIIERLDIDLDYHLLFPPTLKKLKLILFRDPFRSMSFPNTLQSLKTRNVKIRNLPNQLIKLECSGRLPTLPETLQKLRWYISPSKFDEYNLELPNSLKILIIHFECECLPPYFDECDADSTLYCRTVESNLQAHYPEIKIIVYPLAED